MHVPRAKIICRSPRLLRRSGWLSAAISGAFLCTGLWSGLWSGLAIHAAEPAAQRPPPQRESAKRSLKVDHAVMPAGGAHAEAKCGQCQQGYCPAHCPVRPEVFGFYGTQWRRWPGSGVHQGVNDEAATPARPPKAEVPEAAEESLQPDAPPALLPEPDGVDGPKQQLPAASEAPAKKPKIDPLEAAPAAVIPHGRELFPVANSSTSSSAWRKRNASAAAPAAD